VRTRQTGPSVRRRSAGPVRSAFGLVPAPVRAGADHECHESCDCNCSPHQAGIPTKHRFTPFGETTAVRCYALSIGLPSKPMPPPFWGSMFPQVVAGTACKAGVPLLGHVAYGGAWEAKTPDASRRISM
jgi:hypothetical protein